MTSTSSRRSVALAAASVATAAFVAVFRILAQSGFSNDHFHYLTRAVQMLRGAVPVRDYVELGFPLMNALSAAAQVLGGRTLLAEALLVAAAFGLSAGLTLWVVARWSASVWLAAWAVFVQVAVFPRSYSYPKILVFVVAALLMLRYATRPSRIALFCLAVWVAVSFLFRHDLGVSVAVGAVVLATACGLRESFARAARDAAMLAAASALLVAPYVIYVQLAGGLPAYLTAALNYSAREAGRTSFVLPALDGEPVWSAAGLSTIAYYLFWLMPFAALALAWLRRGVDASARALVTAFAMLAVSVNASFLRDPLTARVPDSIVPFAVLAAWAAAAASSSIGTWTIRVATIACLTVTAAGAAQIGNLEEMIARAEVSGGPRRMWLRWRQITGELAEPYAERQMPSHTAFALVPFFRYARACAPDRARILVGGYAPEVPYYAERGFAAGHPAFWGGYFASESEQRTAAARLQRELVPFVVLAPDGVAEFSRSYPLLDTFVAERYARLADFHVEGDDIPARVYIHRNIASGFVYPGTAWPCPNYRPD